MMTDTKAYTWYAIQDRILDCQRRGVRTSRGERMSLAAIARTMTPPVTRSTISLVVSGRGESARVKEAVERELGLVFWIKPRKDQKNDRRAA